MSLAIVRGLAGLALSLSLAAHAEEITVESAEVRLSAMGPAVLLRVGNRAIPVFVDPIVAESIEGALTGRKSARPLSHDLMHNALTVVMRGSTKVFDSRSSDAIALAIHSKAPILVSRELLESAGIDLEAPK